MAPTKEAAWRRFEVWVTAKPVEEWWKTPADEWRWAGTCTLNRPKGPHGVLRPSNVDIEVFVRCI